MTTIGHHKLSIELCEIIILAATSHTFNLHFLCNYQSLTYVKYDVYGSSTGSACRFKHPWMTRPDIEGFTDVDTYR